MKAVTAPMEAVDRATENGSSRSPKGRYVHRIGIFIFVPDFEALIADEKLSLMQTLARRIESPPEGRYVQELSNIIVSACKQRGFLHRRPI